MHIIIAILSALTAAFFAFRYFVDAAHKGREALSDAEGLWRSGKWSRRVDQRLIENLTDPREAAAIALYQIAAYDGAVTEAQQNAILGEMRAAFVADDETAAEFYAFGRMAVGQVEDAGGAMRKLLAPIIEACTEDEKRDFLAMAGRIAAVEGAASEAQTRFIAEAERRLFPR
ncbi:MAG: hypothetical protein AAF224_12535 [Pseudomonadota bacterium]